MNRSQNWVLIALLAPTLVVAQSTKKREIPLWQLPPFDRLRVGDGMVFQTFDLEPVRLEPGLLARKLKANPEAFPKEQAIEDWGLPPVKEIIGDFRFVLFKISMQEDGAKFLVHAKHVKDIEYYEDMLLRKAQELIPLQKMDEAVDYINTVEAISPNWPGLLATKIALFHEEFEYSVTRSAWRPAFDSLRTERRLRDQFDKLPQDQRGPLKLPAIVMEKVFDKLCEDWVGRAVGDKDYTEGRKAITMIEEEFPKSRASAKWRQEYQNRVDALLKQMETREKQKNYRLALDALLEAVDVFPDSPAVRREAERFYATQSLLRVGVGGLASFRYGPGRWSTSDWRSAELIHLPLMRIGDAQEENPFQSDLLKDFAKKEINKQAELTLREDLVWPGDKKPVTVVDVHRLLAGLCRAEDQLYHPAFARLVAGLKPMQPGRLQIDFDRPQFQPAAWLQLPLMRLGFDASLAKSINYQATGFSGLGPYQINELNPKRMGYNANPVYLKKDRPIIQHVRETKYDVAAERMRALKLRSIDMIDYVPPRHHELIKTIPHARLVPVALPRVHVLQFNWDHTLLRHRTLRRALEYAIDRKAILSKLKLKLDDKTQLVSGPLPKGSFGYDNSIEPRLHDQVLAKTLLTAVQEQLKIAAPNLTLAHAGNESTRAACNEIISQLGAIGVKVTLVDIEQTVGLQFTDADMFYHSYSVSDPLFDVVTLLTRNNPSLVRNASPWLRQQLVDLVGVANLTEARSLLPILHRSLVDDVAIIPLWQWQDHIAVADTVEGVPNEVKSVYERIEDWKVKPSYPESHWKPLLKKEAAQANVAAEAVAQKGATP